MKTEPDGKPIIEPTARGLGARPNVDIPVDSQGMVPPGTGGVSVAPDTPLNLPSHRRPGEFGGTGRDAVFTIDPKNLPSDLKYVPDSPTHGTLQPSRSMPLEDYQGALGSTQGMWKQAGH